MSLPLTQQTREYNNFVESPTRGPKDTAREVVVGNSSSNPIPVDPTTRGESKNEYNEINVAAFAVGTIVNFTVPVGKGVDLTLADCSGENLAIFSVEVEGVVKGKRRTWWTDFNTAFKLKETNLVAGQNIKINIENKSAHSGFFNSTLYYNEYDL